MTMRSRGWLGYLLILALAAVAAVAYVPTAARADDPVGGKFVSVSPFRLVDISSGVGGSTTPLGADAYRDYQVTGVGGIPAAGVSAVVVDVAALSLTGATSSAVRVYRAGATKPAAGVVRVEEGSLSKSNTVIARVSTTGKIRVHNAAGDLRFNLDVQGYFTTSGDGTGYIPVEPTRMVSTSGVGIPAGQLAGGAAYDVQITGALVPQGASAVFANVNVVSAEVASGLVLGQGGVSTTGPASVNYRPGVWSDSGLTIKLSTDGKLRVTNLATSGDVSVYVDVQGYFMPGDEVTTGTFNPLEGPPKLYDTLTETPIPAGATRSIPLANIGGLPGADKITAVALTVHALSWASSGSLVLYAADVAKPATTNLAFGNNTDAAVGIMNTALVDVSGDGKIKITNNSTTSAVRVILYAQGWFGSTNIDPADDYPPVPTMSMSPCDGVCSTWATDTATPTLTAGAPVAGKEVGYRFEVRDNAQVPLVSVEQGTVRPTENPSVSWMVPVGAIKTSGTYQVRVTATNGSVSRTGAWRSFDVALVASTPTVIASSTSITTDVVWTRAGSPYLVQAAVNVRSTGSLTMEPGTVVKFAGTAGMIYIRGSRLVAKGSVNRPIVWTSLADDSVMGDSNGDGATTSPAPGDYYSSVKFIEDDADNQSSGVIENVSQRFGGYGSGAYPCQGSYAAVPIEDASQVRIRHSEFMFNDKAGVSVRDEADVVVSNSRFAWSECGVQTNGAGDVVNSVFEPNLLRSWTSGAPSGPQRVEGNWMYAAPQIYIPFTREQVDMRDNEIYFFRTQFRMGSDPDRSDVRFNHWPNQVAGPGVCWPGTEDQRILHGPNLEVTFKSDCPGVQKLITGYEDDVFPMGDAPPFPDAGLEGSPATQSQIEAMFGSGGDLANRGDGEQSDPVNSRSGNYVDHVVDASLPAVGIPVVLQRTYNSLDSNLGVLGRGWSFSFGQRLELESATSAIFVSDEGQRVRFTKSGGSWSGAANVTAAMAQDSAGYTITSRDQTRFRFSNAGQLTWIKDRNDEGVQITRDAQGRVTQIANGGRQLTLAYNGQGLLATATLPDSRTVQYGYTNGALTSVTDTRGKTTTYTYDSSGRLETENDPLGTTVVKLAYDATTGRVSDQWDARNGRSRFLWDPVQETSTVIDPRGGKWVDEYDRGVLSRRIDPLGRAWVYAYDDKLQLRSARDPRGQATQMTYSSAGDMLSSTGPNGRVETTYNTRHDPVQATNAKGVVSTFFYDTAGNLTATTRTASGAATLTETFTVNSRGLVTSATNARGNTSTFEYNGAGDLTKSTSPGGRITTSTYDTVGRVLTTTGPGGNVTGAVSADHTTTYSYNGNDQVTTVGHPTVGTTTTVYDDAGRKTSVTDSRNRTSTFTYDDAGHVLTAKGPDAAIPAETSTYDSVGNLLTQTDSAGRTVSYVYDLAGQPTSATGPSGTFLYTYERGGKLASAKRSGAASSATSKFSYDKRGLLTTINYGDSATPDVTYGYDRHGNRRTMTDGAGTLTYAYDSYDRLTGVTQTAGTGRPSYGYEYDKAGNITRSTGPNGNLTYAYTTDGLLDTVTTNPTGAAPKVLADYDYGPLALPTHATLGNGTSWDRTYDPLGRLSRLVHRNGANAVILDESYTRDAAGNPTAVTRNAGAAGQKVDTYTYDTVDRLSGACYETTTCDNATDFVRWTYDAVGNRTSEIRPTGTATLTYDQATGRLVSINGPPGTTDFTYDNYGRVTGATKTPSGGTASSAAYTYTEANLLKSATFGTTTENYTYDGDGRRLSTATSDRTSTFAWDPNSYLLVNQTDTPTSGAATARSYEYGVGLVGYTTGDPASGAATYNYAHTDPQGSIRATTGPDGLVDRTTVWEPYGTLRSTNVADATAPTPGLGWAGELTNTDGRTHLRARTYDPAMGGFTTPDPAVSTSASATYTYAGSNPMTGADPYGLFLGGLIDGLRDVAPVVATVAGVGAMIPTPLSPLLGGISLAAGLTTSAIAAYDAYNTCTSDKGGCGPAILNAVAETAFTLPGLGTLGRGSRGVRNTGARACSFIGSTVVLMADGSHKPIKDVRVGDRVIATDPETGEHGARLVKQVFVHWDTVLDLVVDGEVITTTEDHPFWSVTDQQFERADRLVRDEFVLARSGQPIRVVGLDAKRTRHGKVYNLEIEDVHTFYVGQSNVLVHNACGTPPPNLSPVGAGRKGAFNQAKRDSGIPTSMSPTRVGPNINRQGKIVEGRTYEFDLPAPGGGMRTVKIRDDAGGHHYADDPSQDRGPHFNTEDGGHYDY